MDKIREILVYKFWILLGFALIAPFVGWWIDSDEVAMVISARKSTIDGKFSGLPQGLVENQDWIDGVEKINVNQQKGIEEAWKALVARQEELKTWPPLLADRIAKLGPDETIPQDDRTRYPREYLKEWDKLYYIVNPKFNYFDPPDEENPEGKEHNLGIVILDPTILQPEYEAWGNLQPTSKEIYAAQEDIWLFRGLFEAIRDVNQGAASINDAVVVEIKSIELPVNLVPKTAGGAEEEQSGGAATEPPPSTGQPLALGRGTIEDCFNLFVPEAPSGAGDQSGQKAEPAEPVEDRRYVEENEQFKTRAFDMELVADHRQLPDILASLSDSPWPIRILRVQQRDVNMTGSDLNSSSPAAATGRGAESRQGGRRGRLNGRKKASRRAAGGQAKSVSIVNIPYLATVQITGTMRIYKKPAGGTGQGAAKNDSQSESLDSPSSRPSPPSEMAEKFPVFEALYGAGSSGRGGSGRRGGR